MSLSEAARVPPMPGERRYLAIAQALKDGILGGEYAIGALLPPERELAERFTVSRQTVRAALRLLREEQLVTSRQGAGTIVASELPRRALPPMTIMRAPKTLTRHQAMKPLIARMHPLADGWR